MDKKTFNTRLDKMYDGEKSRQFVNHIIRSYFPVSKIKKVWEAPRGVFKCAISGELLISGNQIISKLSTTSNEGDYLEFIYMVLTDDNFFEKHVMESKLQGKEMAITGQKTTTIIGLETYRDLYLWFIGKVLSGDEHLYGIVKGLKSPQLIQSLKNIASTPEEIKIADSFDKPKNATSGSYTLGDLGVLQQLKDKMNGKN